jgi:predicted porin
MKKSLLALSILGAFAGVAQAQTNVTMYGVADAGLVRLDNGAAKITKLDSGVYSGSRLGFKGTEDLGGGLQGLFVLETGINIDTGGFAQGNTAFGRQAYVGLGGNFGSVKLGRQQTFSYYAQAAIDPFGIGLAGDSTKFFGGATRQNNTIKYESTNYSGFSAGVSHSFGELTGAPSTESNGANNAVSFQYNNGPIFVETFYEQSKGPIAAPNRTKIFNVGGTYDFGVAKAHLMFDRVRNDISGVAPNYNYRDALVGVSVPFGASTFLADYIKRTDKFGSSDAKQYAIGYTYAMSKRTTLYTSYSRTTNDSGVAYGAPGTNPGGAPGVVTQPAFAAQNGQAFKNFDVGVRHTF